MADPSRLPSRFSRHGVRWGCLLIGLAPILSAQSPAIREFAFLQYEGGPAWTVDQAAASGDILFFRFRAAGLKSIAADDEKKVRFAWTATALDAAHRPFAEPVKGETEVELQPEDKDWTPKPTGSIRLPGFLASGTGKVKITLTDNVANATATGEFEFPIGGLSLLETSSLAIQRVRFLRTEEDGRPLDPPAYVPGDTVWVRFEITGFKASPMREIHVRYGLKVVNATGKQVFERKIAAEERQTYFYIPAYVPGNVALTLDPKAARQNYTLTLIVEDPIAGTAFESEHPFHLQ